MRTTITLDPDVETLVKRAMGRTGGGLKAVVNDALRRALAQPGDGGFEMHPAVVGGQPRIDLDCTGAVLSALDAEDMRRLEEQRSSG